MNEKILIVGPSWVGDMIMAQALFKLLKNARPYLQIDVLAPAWSSPVLARMSEINKVIELPVAHGEFGWRKRFMLGRKLRAHKYTQAIVLTNSWKSALIPFFAKIPVRTGWLGELRWGLLNDVRYLDKAALPKMVQRYVALGKSADSSIPEEYPVPQLNVTPESVQAVINKFSINLDRPILALCPGAAYGPAKRWPMEYFAQLAEQRISAGWQVWFFGSQQDSPVIENIQAQISSKTVSFAGKINLLETIDLFSIVQTVVSNDSGLLHIAASLNKPLVAIYGSTSANFTPPLGKKAMVVQDNTLSCRPCFKRECPLKHMNCMYFIKPDQVLAAMQELESL